MRINTNVAAIIANNSLQNAETRLEQSITRLSSGYKINSSADDPAGCAISEKMRVQLRGLSQSQNNASDGVSVLNTAEGAMSEIQSMLSRMKELTVQAANDVNSDSEREAIQDEINNINKEIDRISNETEFNSQSLINGNLSRRVYSNIEGVKQISCSDEFRADIYGITVTSDARQAVYVSGGAATMTATEQITKEQAGTIEVNGYKIDINEGDTLDTIMEKIVDGVDKIGGKAFTTASTDNDTLVNGSEYAGYKAADTLTGNRIVIMSDQYGSSQSVNIKCDNVQLGNLLGMTNTEIYEDEGMTLNGSDIKAEFTLDDDNKRVGFDDSAVISTDGTRVTVTDVNNKKFVTDMNGAVAGTKFDDVNFDAATKKSVATSDEKVEVEQEVTDVGTMSIHIGANEYQVIKLDIPEISTYTLGTENINVMTQSTASKAISSVDNAIAIANSARSKLGAYGNRFEHTTSNLQISSENLTSALSAMIDTDMATEMTEYTSMNVLSQAATSILAQANERPSSVLQLLQ